MKVRGNGLSPQEQLMLETANPGSDRDGKAILQQEMNSSINMKVLNAKHWQVFMATYGAQLIIPLILGASQTTQPFLARIESSLLAALVITLFWWFWCVAHTLQRFIGSKMRVSTRLFNVAFAVPIVHLIFITTYFARTGTLPLTEPVIIIPHIISILCLLYMIGFAAKIIKLVESGKQVTVNDYVGEFFLVFFFPVGIWLLQPRINRIVKSDAISNPHFEER